MKKLLYILLFVPTFGFSQAQNYLLNCGESITATSTIYGGSEDSEYTSSPSFEAFSINIDSYNTIIEISQENQLLDYNYGYASVELMIFQNGYYYQSYSFEVNDWGGYSDIPSQLTLDPGEYTFVYGISSMNWVSNLNNYIQSYSPQGSYDSFEINFTITMYDGTCFYEGCVYSDALNYNPVATSDDGSCNYLSQYEYLNCGGTITETSTIYGGFGDSEYTSSPSFDAFSINIDSYNTIIEISQENQLLDYNYGYASVELMIFQNGYYYQSYSFEVNDWGGYSDLPSQLTLDPGEYTFVYGISSMNWVSNLNNYIQSYSPQGSYDSFEIDFTITMYDGTCFYEGCLDSLALNFNSFANYDNNQCVYSNDLGEVNCGAPYYVYESISEIGYALINFSVSENNSFIETNLLVSSNSEESIHGQIFLYHNGFNINTFSFFKHSNELQTNSYVPDSIALELGDYSIVVSSSSSLPSYLEELTSNNISVPFDIELELTLYNDNCDYPGCTNSIALNYNPIATIDDGSCKHIIDYGALDCGDNFIFHDTMNVVPPGSTFDDNYDYYNSFSIEVLSNNSILELDVDFEIVECSNWCLTPILWLYKDSNYMTYFSFESMQDTINLDVGEYTFIYGLQQNNPPENINSTPDHIYSNYYYGIYNIEMEFTLYDGTCDYYGCTDINSLNYNDIATHLDNSCIYPVDLGMLNCGQTENFSSTGDSSYSNYLTFEVPYDMNLSMKLLTSQNYPSIYLYDDESQLINHFQTNTRYILDTLIYLNQGVYNILITEAYNANEVQEYLSFFESNLPCFCSYFHFSISQAYDDCDIEGCMDSLALNYNSSANHDDGSCDDYTDFSELSCGNEYVYNSDTLIGKSNNNSWGNQCSGFIDNQVYSSIVFSLDQPSILEYDFELSAFDCQGSDITDNSYITLFACIVKNDTVTDVNIFQSYANESNITGDLFLPTYLSQGTYSLIIFPGGSLPYDDCYIGMDANYLLDVINSGNYNSLIEKYSYEMTIKAYDGTCDYEGCMNNNSINYSPLVTVNNSFLCQPYTSEIICGSSLSNIESTSSDYGMFGMPENIYFIELDNETTIEFTSNEGYFNLRIYEESIFSEVLWHTNLNSSSTFEITLPAGKYFILTESNQDFTFLIDCYGCKDELACNYNDEANISNSMCNYAENDCDYCLDGIIYNSDINNNNICDSEEIYGCNDSTAINFNISANVNDLSCEYYPTSQTILLPSGWSIFSTYLDPLNPDLTAVLDSIKDNVIIAKNNEGQVYMPEFEFNGIGYILKGHGYQVKINSVIDFQELNVFGEFVNPTTNPIWLNEGWNLIGYLRTDEVSAVDIFADLWEDGNLLIAKNYLGGAYLPEWGFNGLGYMQPGQGYQVKTNESGYLWILPMNQNY